MRVKKITPATFVLWILVCILVNFFAFAPKLSDPLAGFFGFGRLYVKIDELNRNTTELVRELAIKNEVKLEDIDNDEE